MLVVDTAVWVGLARAVRRYGIAEHVVNFDSNFEGADYLHRGCQDAENIHC